MPGKYHPFANPKLWGSGLILLGIIGLALPILPGLLFIFLGIYLLKPEWLQKLKNWLVKK